MGPVVDSMAENMASLIWLVPAILFVGASYFILTLDRGRANSPSKDDTQVGIKLVLFGIILAGIEMAVGGTEGLLGYILGGFKGGSGVAKSAIPPILVGVGAVFAVTKLFLPRTNAATARQPERYLLGALGLQFGVMLIGGLVAVLNDLVMSQPWASTSHALANTAVAGAIAVFAVGRFGARSGWTMPAPPMAPPAAQYPPQGGGYPPQGGGYNPQGGGYNPQGGGYNPQGGGYPPQQGGGYPPQGGGFPPQGGGYQR